MLQLTDLEACGSGDRVYTFKYTLADVDYWSAIIFDGPRDRKALEHALPRIRGELSWLGANLAAVTRAARRHLGPADLPCFDRCEIGSLSLAMDASENLGIRLSFGTPEDGIHFIATVQDRSVAQVDVNA